MKSMKVSKGQLDRISELPEFILHLILSFLRTEESCRISILSKHWYNVWGSIPTLDFKPDYVKMERPKCFQEFCDEKTVQCYVEYIDKTMIRYSMQKHFIKRFNLEFHMGGEGFSSVIDKWVGIAVECRIEELKICMILLKFQNYRLPETIFSAKSLKVLKCRNVVLPYYETMKLDSLQCLELARVSVNVPMLERILASCPLVDVGFEYCYGLNNISIPWAINDHNSDIKTSKLERFVYFDSTDCSWPFKMIVGSLKNLRKLEIYYAWITDEIVSVMASELLSLEELELNSCLVIESVEISSKTLKKLFIVDCFELKKATIDAPKLVKFWYNGEPKLSLSVINVPVHCDTQFYVTPQFLSIEWFLTLKEFLLKSNIFKTLELNLGDCTSQIETEDLLNQFDVGPLYKLKELNLHETADWLLTYSSLSTFFNGIFQICRPNVLTVFTTTYCQNMTVQRVLASLKDKVKCWRHPLKHIEVEAVDFSDLLSKFELKIRLRLSW